MKKSIALALTLLLLASVLVACDSNALLYGNWVDEDEVTEYYFDENGEGYTTYMDFPIDFEYVKSDDGILTVKFSETISQTGKITFYGDHEFVWEIEDDEGNSSPVHFTRKVVSAT